MDKPTPGSIGWVDLTVPDADALRDFYAQVVGWKPQPVDMGGYADYNMLGPSDTPVAGVCHSRGVNAGIPAVWMVYITVADMDAALAAVQSLGGKTLGPVKGTKGKSRTCIIQDPAGAVCTLYEG